ncbi:hypothetical protein KP509_30G042500 [Ceratopteris richardii]|nr:hypothetical protein KP509_30G042500 [Ceratopteris richardii]
MICAIVNGSVSIVESHANAFMGLIAEAIDVGLERSELIYRIRIRRA